MSKGSYNWFSAPSARAHLQAVKEQSRNKIGSEFIFRNGTEKYGRVSTLIKEANITTRCAFLFISQSQIWQFLKVLAMSVLTTSDLDQTSLVTCKNKYTGVCIDPQYCAINNACMFPDVKPKNRIVTSVDVQQAFNTVQSGKRAKATTSTEK